MARLAIARQGVQAGSSPVKETDGALVEACAEPVMTAVVMRGLFVETMPKK
jgi:hypothetical protein